MSNHIKALLRGDAVAYAVVDLEKVPRNTNVGFCATSGSLRLPCGCYEAPELLTDCTFLTGAIRQGTEKLRIQPPPAGTSRFVATFPLIGSEIKLTPYFLSPSLKKTLLPSNKISPFKLKWKSRLEYRNHPLTSRTVRDIEKRHLSRQITTSTICILTTADSRQIIVKGEASAPLNTDIKTLVLSKTGAVEHLDINWGKLRESRMNGLNRSCRTFSFRLPRINDLSCVIFYTDDPIEARPAFFSIEQDFLERERERYELDDPFYRILRIDRYQTWARLNEKKGRPEFNLPDNGPKFSIIVPLYNTPRRFFEEMLASVQDQSYKNWELILVNASPSNTELQNCLKATSDNRIKIITLESNGGISRNTNAGVAESTGDYICFFDHDDLLDLDVLSEYASVILRKQDTDVLYCDEDLFHARDGRQTPQLKPDFNIDLLRANNYITHFLCVRASLAKETPLRPNFDGAQDYDMVLRLSEKTTAFEHIPRVLYHWRIHANSTAQNADNKSYAIEAGRLALNEHMHRVEIPGHAENAPWACLYRMSFDFPETPLVSIIIPNKDGVELLEPCIKSIEDISTYRNFEIIIIENNSETSGVFDLYKDLERSYENIRVVTWESEFNYSKINNFGVAQSKGEYLILLNSDTEVIAPDWIQAMLGYCRREDVGAVGARLLYSDDTIQHAGIMIKSPTSTATTPTFAHVYRHHEREWPGASYRAQLPQDLMAVTAACMMVSRKDYDRVGGLSEDFAIAYNDIDFCLKLHQAGLLVVYTPYAELYHFENGTREIDDSTANPAQQAQYLAERGLLLTRWANILCKTDPYFGSSAQVVL